MKDIRIVYMGTPEMSAQILEKMIEDGFNIVGVIAQEDKPVGRKGILEPVPTKRIALEHHIPVFQPHRIRKEFDFVRDLKPDLILTMAYGQIIPHELLEIPTIGAVNLHGSILPKYRGAAPIQRAIWDGEKETGVTLMEMVDEMDAGDMFAVEKCEILDSDTYSIVCDKIVACCIKLVEEKLVDLCNGKLPKIPQNTDEITFANKILPEDEKLNLTENCWSFLKHAHALSEHPGAYVFVDGKKLKIFKVQITNKDVSSPIGTLIIDKKVRLQLSDGQLEILELQMEGKKKMDGRSFANGNHQLNGVKIN